MNSISAGNIRANSVADNARRNNKKDRAINDLLLESDLMKNINAKIRKEFPIWFHDNDNQERDIKWKDAVEYRSELIAAEILLLKRKNIR